MPYETDHARMTALSLRWANGRPVRCSPHPIWASEHRRRARLRRVGLAAWSSDLAAPAASRQRTRIERPCDSCAAGALLLLLILPKLAPPKLPLPKLACPTDPAQIGPPKLALPQLALPKLALPKLALPRALANR